MTPVAAIVSSPAETAVAPSDTWTRHVAAIRAYFGDAWFAGRLVVALNAASEINQLASLGARVVDAANGIDPDREWPFGHVDLVLHLGLLPHLDVSHASLHLACSHAGNVVVETAVCDAQDPDCITGHFPSAARIERILAEHGMLFQRLADSRCNGPDRVYDWLAADTGRVTPGQHRLWFARRG